MPRKLFLPLASPSSGDRPPTGDVGRKRLGGRASTEAGAGELVTLPDGRSGVVLFVRGDQLDVWLEGEIVRRVRRADASAADGVIPPELFEVAKDARAFGGRREGERVSFRQEGTLRLGTLVEKCRFGALVEVDSGVVVGVAFRRLLAVGTEAGAAQ